MKKDKHCRWGKQNDIKGKTLKDKNNFHTKTYTENLLRGTVEEEKPSLYF